jgi:hypothetical protein
MRLFLIFILTFLGTTNVFPQKIRNKDSINVLQRRVIDGDTTFISEIPEVKIYPEGFYRRKMDLRKYQRLIRNVKAAYPYSKIAGKVLLELNTSLATVDNNRQREAIINQTEKQLRAQFEGAVKNLTITQGRILVKLVHRETGNTTFAILKELKGGFSAGFWQTIARIFGNNLKSKYDPYGDDAMIEVIIIMLESGQI